MNFNDYISDTRKNVGGKLNILARIAPFTGFSKRRILINPFFNFQFSYYSFIWMCHSHTNYRKINRLRERCLRFI